MSLEPAAQTRIDQLIREHDVTLFMKGNRQMPQCGFSATVVRILDQLVSDYGTIDVLSDSEIRENIKVYSSWPTIPQLYVKGEFVGGCDIIQEMFAKGELHALLGVEIEEADPPEITITDPAAAALRSAIEQNAGEGRELHLAIDASFQNNLFFGPRMPGETEAVSNGVCLVVDALTAKRAGGLVIDAAETDRGPGFRIDNPNAPQVKQLSVSDLKKKLDAGEALELFDVRTPEERATASIPGSRLLTDEEQTRLASLPRDTQIVFHCHHGGRSQQAADHFLAQGFTNVSNLAGGIDAWSLEVDPSVPRY